MFSASSWCVLDDMERLEAGTLIVYAVTRQLRALNKYSQRKRVRNGCTDSTLDARLGRPVPVGSGAAPGRRIS